MCFLLLVLWILPTEVLSFDLSHMPREDCNITVIAKDVTTMVNIHITFIYTTGRWFDSLWYDTTAIGKCVGTAVFEQTLRSTQTCYNLSHTLRRVRLEAEREAPIKFNWFTL